MWHIHEIFAPVPLAGVDYGQRLQKTIGEWKWPDGMTHERFVESVFGRRIPRRPERCDCYDPLGVCAEMGECSPCECTGGNVDGERTHSASAKVSEGSTDG